MRFAYFTLISRFIFTSHLNLVLHFSQSSTQVKRKCLSQQTKAINRQKIPLDHTKRTQQLSFWKQKPKSRPPYWRQVAHQWPQTTQGEPVAKTEKCWLSCNSVVKEPRCISPNSLFKNNIRGQKHPKEVDKYINSIPKSKHFRLHNNCKHSVQDYYYDVAGCQWVQRSSN